jgi:hypothetical protein
VPGDAPGDQNGSVLYSYNNIDTYRFVEPKGEGEVAGTSSTTVIVAVVIVALAVAGGATLLLRRGRGRAETE